MSPPDGCSWDGDAAAEVATAAAVEAAVGCLHAASAARSLPKPLLPLNDLMAWTG